MSTTSLEVKSGTVLVQDITSIGTSSITHANCHRCGKPTTGTYINGQPTCAWCVAELEAKRGNWSEPWGNYSTGPSPKIAPREETIRIKYFTHEIWKLQYIDKGNWIDLRAAEDIKMKAGEFKLIPLGVAIELPQGYEAIMAPRSSTFKKYGVFEANSIGVIDESYCGDNDMWRFAAYATRDTFIAQNERICQFRIIEHQPHLNFETVESLGNVDRSGFGSTGTI